MESIKQELVDKVAKSDVIVPQLLQISVDLPSPTVSVEYVDIKRDLLVNRRSTQTQIENDYPNDYKPKIRVELEIELLNFLLDFKEYEKVLL